jgi:hypothetical protein
MHRDQEIPANEQREIGGLDPLVGLERRQLEN